ncbi:hypothetical protein [Thomasclavelia cocleata]|uniref:hypothetical protein n=1 Tax=Thomasclavelia cocleata TaxID=69824 RepID=UPI0024302389|nr:hypothetical protein [Thomasclavelia cocleata]
MKKNCVICGKEFNSKNGIITCSDECYETRNKERLEKNELIRQNKLEREHKKCPICGKKFEVNKKHLVYCSTECREIATKEKKKKYFKNYYEDNKDEIIERVMRNKKR